MTYFVVIPRGDGVITHRNVDVESISLPNDAEIYESRESFEDRLSDFEIF